MNRLSCPVIVLSVFLCLSFVVANSWGNSLRFDGVNDTAYIPATSQLNFDNSSSYTVELWFKSGYSGSLIEKYNDNLGYPYSISLNSTGSLTASCSDGVHVDSISAGSNLNDNSWHHVALVKEGGMKIELYIDDHRAASKIDLECGSYSNKRNVILANNNGTNFFNGLIDEIRIWNRALSEIEMMCFYRKPRIGNEDGLVGYYQFNESIGTVAADATSYHHNIKLGDFTGSVDKRPFWMAQDPEFLKGVSVIRSQANDDPQVPGSIISLYLLFNGIVDPASFSSDDIQWSGPGGPIQISSIEPLSDYEWKIGFNPQYIPGTYDLAVGANIIGDGLLMNQDNDSNFGEWPDDVFSEQFDIRYTYRYNQDFEGEIGSEWSHNLISVTPLGNRRFLGRFCNDTISIDLAKIEQTITQGTISFDLYLIDSWDGNASGPGPDIWQCKMDDEIILRTTFSNLEESNYNQSYPEEYPNGNYPAGKDAIAIDSLGYSFYGDSVYRLSFEFNTLSPPIFYFSSSGLQGLGDESWGIDNVSVEIYGAIGPAIKSHSPSGITSRMIDGMDFVFGAPVDPATFSIDDITIIVPENASPITIENLVNIEDNLWHIDFDQTITDFGDYTISVGPDLKDIYGRSPWYPTEPNNLYLASFTYVDNLEFASNITIASENDFYENEDIIVNGCTLTLNGQHSFRNLSIINNGVVTHDADSILELTVSGDLLIESGGSLHANGKGYAAYTGPGAPVLSSGRAASHGGYGYEGGPTYGSITEPAEPGSGGYYGTGGGVIRLTVGGEMTINGTLSANGDGWSSGGSIYLSVAHLLGGGLIASDGSGRGGGGRIAVYYADNEFTGTLRSNGASDGGAGTVYLKSAEQSYGDLLISSGQGITPLLEGTYQFDRIEVSNARLELSETTVVHADEVTFNGSGSNYAAQIAGELHARLLTVASNYYGQVEVTGLVEAQAVQVRDSGLLSLGAGGQIQTISTQLSSSGKVTVNSDGYLQSVNLSFDGGNLELNGTGDIGLDDLVIPSGVLTLNRPRIFQNLTIGSSGQVTCATETPLELTVSGDLLIETGGSLHANGRGYAAYTGPGAPGLWH